MLALILLREAFLSKRSVLKILLRYPQKSERYIGERKVLEKVHIDFLKKFTILTVITECCILYLFNESGTFSSKKIFSFLFLGILSFGISVYCISYIYLFSPFQEHTTKYSSGKPGFIFLTSKSTALGYSAIASLIVVYGSFSDDVLYFFQCVNLSRFIDFQTTHPIGFAPFWAPIVYFMHRLWMWTSKASSLLMSSVSQLEHPWHFENLFLLSDLRKRFLRGDWISVKPVHSPEVSGKIWKIRPRITSIELEDGTFIHIPNKELKNVVTHVRNPLYRRAFWIISLQVDCSNENLGLSVFNLPNSIYDLINLRSDMEDLVHDCASESIFSKNKSFVRLERITESRVDFIISCYINKNEYIDKERDLRKRLTLLIQNSGVRITPRELLPVLSDPMCITPKRFEVFEELSENVVIQKIS